MTREIDPTTHTIIDNDQLAMLRAAQAWSEAFWYDCKTDIIEAEEFTQQAFARWRDLWPEFAMYGILARMRQITAAKEAEAEQIESSTGCIFPQ